MSFIITKETTERDFDQKFIFESEENLLNSLINEIKIYEDKYNMSSSEFYKSYTNNQLIDEDEYEEWYAKILMYSKCYQINPENIKLKKDD